jgi:hypothetical protein
MEGKIAAVKNVQTVPIVQTVRNANRAIDFDGLNDLNMLNGLNK